VQVVEAAVAADGRARRVHRRQLGSLNTGAVSAVGKKPGPMALQVMPCDDQACAMARVSCTTPPLPAP
jgi:hypothetical protein